MPAAGSVRPSNEVVRVRGAPAPDGRRPLVAIRLPGDCIRPEPANRNGEGGMSPPLHRRTGAAVAVSTRGPSASRPSRTSFCRGRDETGRFCSRGPELQSELAEGVVAPSLKPRCVGGVIPPQGRALNHPGGSEPPHAVQNIRAGQRPSPIDKRAALEAIRHVCSGGGTKLIH